MKKLILILFVVPVICFGQKSDTTKNEKKIKFQYVQSNFTYEQIDTLSKVLRAGIDIIPFSSASLEILGKASHIETVYEEPKNDTSKKK